VPQKPAGNLGSACRCVNYSDPFGLFPCPELCGGAIAGGGVIALGGLGELAGALGGIAAGAAAGTGVGVAVGGAVALGIALSRPMFPGAKISMGHGQGTWASEATGTSRTPDLPDGLTGENPREGSGSRINTDLPGDAQGVFDRLTGGQSRTEPGGHRVGPNGVRLRPGTQSKGPRVDIPAKGQRPHETIHFPPGSQ
jgi:filamentous hemagglutinin